MREGMMELARMMGFDFTATTFPELIMFFTLAICGSAILASIIKVMFWVTFNTRKLAR